MASSGAKLLDEQDFSDFSGDESTRFNDDIYAINQRTAQETKGWNIFRELPVKQESGSMETKEWIDVTVKVLKLLAYLVTFALVLGAAVIAKGTLLFMTAQVKKGRQVTHCNRLLGLDQQFVAHLPAEERVAWLWGLLIVFAVPELGTFFRSARICYFKTATKPKTAQLLMVLLIESLHTVGVAALLLLILPELDALKGAMLANCVCFVPGLLSALSRSSHEPGYLGKVVLDVVSLSAQATGFLVWPLRQGTASLWLMPAACVLVSLAWWENYVDRRSTNRIMRALARLKEEIKHHRYPIYRTVAPCKVLVFLLCIPLSLWLTGDDPWSFFSSLPQVFDDRQYTVREVQIVIQDVQAGIMDTMETDLTFELPISWMSPIWVTLIQVVAAYVCFASAKYACKVLIQGFSFSLALSLVVPVTINLLIVMCGMRNANPCAFHWTIPDYLFFEIPPVYFLKDYLEVDVAWIWLLWLLSQMWITVHIWLPRCERLAVTEKLFALPHYSGAFLDQSLVLNRSKDEEIDLKFQDLKNVEETANDDIYDTMSVNTNGSESMYKSDVKSSDHVTRIYCCATMWHETKDEMMEFLKSIFRLDEDQCARRVAQKYLRVVDPDYYELEPHIFMDDAFEVSDHSSEDSQVNRFVRLLVESVDDAASEVHLTNVRLRPPKKYPTPYGGRLVWTLPGKNKLVCHLKDKSKIRHRKRWSQVMYMYYMLGHRLMDLPISVDRKEVIAENTYLLALDGDIDFQPRAVMLLIDLMKKNKNLGAACGRIHPMGSGPMVWYQMFEYAIGHWLQKATEHMIGCVLCSPGCFSLFRGKALMDDNVMRKYTLNSSEARHYVQYDQGEDRWLCTLLLQRGYRVEYSAASDAYTHCPEGFNEFYNQRRRWVPSTMANILDLLSDSKRTISVNDNVSRLYISYQIMLMAGTILGPGTIFLMLVGAIVAAFGLSNWQALQINIVPVVLFLIICMICKSETQLFFAGLITCFYGLVMMAVLLGIALQIAEDGWLAPSSVFTIATFGVFFITAALHPQELNCLFYIMVYYITIPSMYMLLIIYSLCNMNNVTWGTREVTQKKTAKEMEIEKLEAEAAKVAVKNKSILSNFQGKGSDEKSGTLELGVAGLFKCICCTNPSDHKEDLHLLQISSSLERLETKLASYHHAALGGELPETMISRRRSSMGMRGGDLLKAVPEYSESVISSDIPREERDDLSNPYWIEDPNLQKGEVDFLTTAEIQFWKDLIDAYLRPIEENKEEQDRIKKDLKDLRDKMVFGFVMLNALFVLVIFLLQLNQDVLHIPWPFGQKVNLTYLEDNNIVLLEREYLQLEPIGSVFLIFFGVVMVVQFTAMLFHRFGTLTHLLSTVQLNWYCTQKATDMSESSLLEKHAVEIVKDLQKLNVETEGGGGGGSDGGADAPAGRRQTVHNLERARQSKPNIGNLDAAFKKRFFSINADEQGKLSMSSKKTSLRRATLRALETRRNSLVAERRRSQAQAQAGPAPGAVFQYNMPRTTVNKMAGGGRPSVSAVGGRASLRPQYNAGYEPAFDSESDDDFAALPSVAPPRKSTVVFKDYKC